jgi:predicted 3-demethylubiquinone-9 3-methyltransferase (glyoxalase superfamily)
MAAKQRIIANLWFDSEAEQAAGFYTSTFKSSRVGHVTRYTKAGFDVHHMPEGTVMTVEFEIEGQKFIALNGGPVFKFNPSISFMVNLDPSKDKNARKNIDTLWEKLSDGGTPLMPLQEYPFSKRYGWVQDKYGLSWQLILSDPGGEKRPFIVPSLMFVGGVSGKAEEAIGFYLSVFRCSKRGIVARYGSGQEPDKEGTIMFADFMIENQWFAAMDSARTHDFAFNEAISFMVRCENQKEIDYYWEKLSAVPEAEQCGWLKDKYGVSWQIVPTVMDEMLRGKDAKRVARVTEAFLKMKKVDITKLKEAHEGN